MTTLVLGGHGLLGRRICQVLHQRGQAVLAASRSDPHHPVDVTDAVVLRGLLDRHHPTTVINCVAEVDLAACEADPDHAFAVNAKPVETLAQWCHVQHATLVQISTDQLFGGQGAVAHDEDSPIILHHVYAASKYAGEQAARQSPNHLIVRTNLTDIRSTGGKTPFARWVLDQAKSGVVPGFDDYFCSTLDALSLAAAVLDLIAEGARGTLHVGSSDVVSKADFIERLLQASGVPARVDRTSATMLTPPRALSSGLDVRRAESVLRRSLPTCAQVVKTLAALERTDAL